MEQRKILIISGADIINVLTGEHPNAQGALLKSKLQGKYSVQLIGDGKGGDTTKEELVSGLDQLKPGEKLTIIIETHGEFKNGGFSFKLGNNCWITSKELFSMLREKCSNTPIEVFSPSCYAGAMMFDRNILPAGSVLVSLTSAGEINNSGDYKDMVNKIDECEVDLTVYNLLQIYLQKYLKNRYTPMIGVSGGEKYNLNDVFVDYMRRFPSAREKFKVDEIDTVYDPQKMSKVIEKMTTSDNERKIYAVDYGTALSLILDKMAKKEPELKGDAVQKSQSQPE